MQERHAIIGIGNLGSAIMHALTQQNIEARVTNRSRYWRWPEDIEDLRDYDPTHIWYTAGKGSVEAAHTLPWVSFDAFVNYPLQIIGSFPKAKIVYFSTNFVADTYDYLNPNIAIPEPRSVYETAKKAFETSLRLLGSANVACIRVGNLYGGPFWDRCFPGKVIKNIQTDTIKITKNYCTPTPVDWIAEQLVNNRKRIFSDKTPTFHHLAPHGQISNHALARKILIESPFSSTRIKSGGIDKTRPSIYSIGNTVSKDFRNWKQLWDQYWPGYAKVAQAVGVSQSGQSAEPEPRSAPSHLHVVRPQP